jgi:hypothetical protein
MPFCLSSAQVVATRAVTPRRNDEAPPVNLTWKTMLRSNAFADSRSRCAASALGQQRDAARNAAQRGASDGTGIAAQTMVQLEPGAPPG